MMADDKDSARIRLRSRNTKPTQKVEHFQQKPNLPMETNFTQHFPSDASNINSGSIIELNPEAPAEVCKHPGSRKPKSRHSQPKSILKKSRETLSDNSENTFVDPLLSNILQSVQRDPRQLVTNLFDPNTKKVLQNCYLKPDNNSGHKNVPFIQMANLSSRKVDQRLTGPDGLKSDHWHQHSKHDKGGFGRHHHCCSLRSTFNESIARRSKESISQKEKSINEFNRTNTKALYRATVYNQPRAIFEKDPPKYLTSLSKQKNRLPETTMPGKKDIRSSNAANFLGPEPKMISNMRQLRSQNLPRSEEEYKSSSMLGRSENFSEDLIPETSPPARDVKRKLMVSKNRKVSSLKTSNDQKSQDFQTSTEENSKASLSSQQLIELCNLKFRDSGSSIDLNQGLDSVSSSHNQKILLEDLKNQKVISEKKHTNLGLLESNVHLGAESKPIYPTKQATVPKVEGFDYRMSDLQNLKFNKQTETNIISQHYNKKNSFLLNMQKQYEDVDQDANLNIFNYAKSIKASQDKRIPGPEVGTKKTKKVFITDCRDSIPFYFDSSASFGEQWHQETEWNAESNSSIHMQESESSMEPCDERMMSDSSQFFGNDRSQSIAMLQPKSETYTTQPTRGKSRTNLAFRVSDTRRKHSDSMIYSHEPLAESKLIGHKPETSMKGVKDKHLKDNRSRDFALGYANSTTSISQPISEAMLLNRGREASVINIKTCDVKLIDSEEHLPKSIKTNQGIAKSKNKDSTGIYRSHNIYIGNQKIPESCFRGTKIQVSDEQKIPHRKTEHLPKSERTHRGSPEAGNDDSKARILGLNDTQPYYKIKEHDRSDQIQNNPESSRMTPHKFHKTQK